MTTPRRTFRSVVRLRTVAVALGLAVVAGLVVQPVGADQLSDKRAEATKIAARLSELDASMMEVNARFEAANFKLHQAEAAVAEARRMATITKAEMEKRAGELRGYAVHAKVQGEVAELVRREQEAIRAAAAAAAASRRSASAGSSSRSSSQVSVNVPPANGSVANAAIRAGLTKVGSPYVWAAAGPNAFDCSGFTQWAFGQAGVSLPHFSGAVYAMTTRISASQLQPGDFVFWGSSGSAHLAIYMGNDQLVHAFGSGGVAVTALEGWWMPPSGYGRLNL